ncbi:unnamed protein product [Penicillium salamii]|nr:unnamed protein product [Penicillium salamii]
MFQTILLTAEPSHTDSIEPTKMKCSRLGCATPPLSRSRREEIRSLSQIWDYVHRVCAARKLRYR